MLSMVYGPNVNAKALWTILKSNISRPVTASQRFPIMPLRAIPCYTLNAPYPTGLRKGGGISPPDAMQLDNLRWSA